jgi:GTP-binding protein
MQKWKDPFAVRARTRLARVVDVASLPPPIPGVPEMAIIGRSNVGKSTLLNSVLNIRGARKAAVADRPGVTQSLDFYMLGPRDR